MNLRIKFLIMLIATQKVYKLTTESFVARLKQATLVSKTNFDNKLITSNERITSNETKHLEAQKKKKN